MANNWNELMVSRADQLLEISQDFRSYYCCNNRLPSYCIGGHYDHQIPKASILRK